MVYPKELKYTKEHEWIKLEGKNAAIGVTSYAIEQLGDVVYLDLPKVNTEFNVHDAFGTIESTKTVSDLYTPVKCKVLEVNQVVLDTPEMLSQDAYQNGWLIKVEIVGELPTTLLDAEEYQKYIHQLSS